MRLTFDITKATRTLIYAVAFYVVVEAVTHLTWLYVDVIRLAYPVMP